jgi:hypothetical protein
MRGEQAASVEAILRGSPCKLAMQIDSDASFTTTVPKPMAHGKSLASAMEFLIAAKSAASSDKTIKSDSVLER